MLCPIRSAPLAFLLGACVGAGSLDGPLIADDDATPSPGPKVLITELMYHPVDEESYEDLHEFIEIHNAGERDAALGGWGFDRGVEFAFPEHTLAPGQSVIVARDGAALGLRWTLPSGVLLGDYEGTLDNGGEELRLVDADGTTVDSLTWRDESPWPLGADALGASDPWLPPGSVPSAAHQYRGRSLQRLSVDPASNNPGNWYASPLDGANPGAWSPQALAPRPVLTGLRWNGGAVGPLPPGSALTVEVTPSGGSIAELRAEWFRDDLSATGEFVGVTPLRDDGLEGDPVAGDGQFSGIVPPQPERSVLRVRVLGDDGGGDSVLLPRDGDPMSWFPAFVGSPIPGETPPYQILINPTRWTQLWDAIAPGRVPAECAPNPDWDLDVPAVFIRGGEVWDVQVRYQGSRWNRVNGRTMPAQPGGGPDRPSPLRALSWNVKFPRYAPMDGRSGLLLNKLSQSCPGLTTMVGFGLFDAVDLPVPEAHFARLFINGDYYNYVLAMERPGEELLSRWLERLQANRPDWPPEPGLPHFWKSGGCNCDEGPYGWGDERPLAPFCGYDADERYSWTYEAKTWNWAGPGELRLLIEGLDTARATGDAALRAWLDDHFVVDSVLDYMVIMNWAGGVSISVR